MQKEQLTESPTPTSVFTTPEAAIYLKIKTATLEQWRWNGNGPRFIKLSRSVRYRRSDLDDFMNSRVFENTTEAQTAKTKK